MRRDPIALVVVALLAGGSAGAQPVEPADRAAVVVATRTIPSRTTIGPDDVALSNAVSGSGLASIYDAIGREARVSLYKGRPILAQNLRAPALIERNALVTLQYRRGGLTITVEGRALDRGAQGERIRVMNLGSRQTVSGEVLNATLVEVAR